MVGKKFGVPVMFSPDEAPSVSTGVASSLACMPFWAVEEWAW